MDEDLPKKWFDGEIILFDGTKYENLLDVPVDKYDQVKEAYWMNIFFEAQHIFCKFINMKSIEFDTRDHEHDYYEIAKTEFIDEIANLQSLENISFYFGGSLGNDCFDIEYEIVYSIENKIIMIGTINFDKITEDIKYVNIIHPCETTDFTKLPDHIEYLHITGIYEHFNFTKMPSQLKKLTLSSFVLTTPKKMISNISVPIAKIVIT